MNVEPLGTRGLPSSLRYGSFSFRCFVTTTGTSFLQLLQVLVLLLFPQESKIQSKFNARTMLESLRNQKTGIQYLCDETLPGRPGLVPSELVKTFFRRRLRQMRFSPLLLALLPTPIARHTQQIPYARVNSFSCGAWISADLKLIVCLPAIAAG